MKGFTIFLTILTLSIFLMNCTTQKKMGDKIVISDNSKTQNTSMVLEKGKYFNHPTFVIWVEDKCGNFLKTIYITQSYASGIFNKKMIGDTLWLDEKGESIQPAALPYWTHRSGFNVVPNQSKPYTDAYSGATPQSDFEFKTGVLDDIYDYQIYLEVNQAWDWNKYWTNDKYPDNYAYKHSAQPSIIYRAFVDNNTSEFYLNPVGHGDPTGKTGNLYTDLSTITTAKDIFKNIILKSNYKK